MVPQQNWPFVINLGNSIIGVSVLAMPFCFKQCGVILGTVLLLSSTWLTNKSCKLLMKAAVTSKRRSYEFLALHTFGAAGKLAVEVSIIGLLLGTCIAFFVIIGDLGPAIIAKLLGMENTPNLRVGLMCFLGMFVALPLGLLRNIESLSNISAASIGFYTVFVAEVILTAFPHLWSGHWVTKVDFWRTEGVFQCLPIFSMSLACQTQLFVMYDALPEPSLSRMNTIVNGAVALCASVYLAVGFFGYVAFCEEPLGGDVLMSFQPTIFSEAIKLGFVLSVAVSFPLCIFPCRASINTLLFSQISTHGNIGGAPIIPPLRFKVITAGIVIGTLIIGILVPNVEFVLGLTGATMGTMICYIFPAVMFISVMSSSNSGGKSSAQLVLFLGVTILLASTYTTLQSNDQSQNKASIVLADNKVDLKVDHGLHEHPNIPTKGELLEADKSLNVKDEGGGRVRGKPKDADQEKNPDKPLKIKKPKKGLKGKENDIRQEPPIPHAPDDIKVNVDINKNESKQVPPVVKTKAGAETKDTLETESNSPVEDEMAEKKEKEEKEKKAQALEQKKREQHEKQLIKALEQQQEQQKKLIVEQKKIIKELQDHKKEHEEEDKKQQTIKEESAQQQGAQVQQQQPAQQQSIQQGQQPVQVQPQEGQGQQQLNQNQQQLQGQKIQQQPVQGQQQQQVQQQPLQGQQQQVHQQPVQGQQQAQHLQQQSIQGQQQQSVQGQQQQVQAQQQAGQPIKFQQQPVQVQFNNAALHVVQQNLDGQQVSQQQAQYNQPSVKSDQQPQHVQQNQQLVQQNQQVVQQHQLQQNNQQIGQQAALQPNQQNVPVQQNQLLLQQNQQNVQQQPIQQNNQQQVVQQNQQQPVAQQNVQQQNVKVGQPLQNLQYIKQNLGGQNVQQQNLQQQQNAQQQNVQQQNVRQSNNKQINVDNLIQQAAAGA